MPGVKLQYTVGDWQAHEGLDCTYHVMRFTLAGRRHAGSTGFEHLQTLLLRDNHLSRWRDVDSLNRLACLTDLRLTGNPILHDARGGGRYEVSFTAFLVVLKTQNVGVSTSFATLLGVHLCVLGSRWCSLMKATRCKGWGLVTRSPLIFLSQSLTTDISQSVTHSPTDSLSG